MEKSKEGIITKMLSMIYHMSALNRCIIIWLCFQGILWFVFGLGYITHKEAWTNVVEVEASTAAVGGWWTTLLFIVANNLVICLLLIVGNLFVRFHVFTPGLFVLLMQAVMIGWMAGTNGFEIPFVNVSAANIQFLRIGIWETTAYALAFAVTLPKSLLIADTFPAKKWSETKRLKDVRFNSSEILLLIFGGLVLILAAIVETFAIVKAPLN